MFLSFCFFSIEHVTQWIKALIWSKELYLLGESAGNFMKSTTLRHTSRSFIAVLKSMPASQEMTSRNNSFSVPVQVWRRLPERSQPHSRHGDRSQQTVFDKLIWERKHVENYRRFGGWRFQKRFWAFVRWWWDLERSATYPIYVQWGFNLVSAGANGVFLERWFIFRLVYILGTSYQNL